MDDRLECSRSRAADTLMMMLAYCEDMARSGEMTGPHHVLMPGALKHVEELVAEGFTPTEEEMDLAWSFCRNLFGYAVLSTN